jgi:hypothetical protein
MSGAHLAALKMAAYFSAAPKRPRKFRTSRAIPPSYEAAHIRAPVVRARGPRSHCNRDLLARSDALVDGGFKDGPFATNRERRSVQGRAALKNQIGPIACDHPQLARIPRNGRTRSGPTSTPGRWQSCSDLLNLLGTIAQKGAGFKSLRDTWADTTTAHGRLMLTVLGGLVEFERELIRTRTGEGR